MLIQLYQIGMAMRVRENAPTANIRTYMRLFAEYADMQTDAHQKKWRMANPNCNALVET